MEDKIKKLNESLVISDDVKGVGIFPKEIFEKLEERSNRVLEHFSPAEEKVDVNKLKAVRIRRARGECDLFISKWGDLDETAHICRLMVKFLNETD